MRVRLLAILSLALLLFIMFSGSPLAFHIQAPATFGDCSPPVGLEVPVGQGVEVRCHVLGEPEATVEFVVDGESRGMEQVLPNGVASFSWSPQNAGRHTLELVAKVKGRESARFVRLVLAVPHSSPVRIR